MLLPGDERYHAPPTSPYAAQYPTEDIRLYGKVEVDDNDDHLEESSVKFIERVDVGEEEGECLLWHRVLFGDLVPEPLMLEVGIEGRYRAGRRAKKC